MLHRLATRAASFRNLLHSIATFGFEFGDDQNCCSRQHDVVSFGRLAQHMCVCMCTKNWRSCIETRRQFNKCELARCHYTKCQFTSRVHERHNGEKIVFKIQDEFRRLERKHRNSLQGFYKIVPCRKARKWRGGKIVLSCIMPISEKYNCKAARKFISGAIENRLLGYHCSQRKKFNNWLPTVFCKTMQNVVREVLHYFIMALRFYICFPNPYTSIVYGAFEQLRTC